MKLILFSGFLGAGKTVAILSLAAHIMAAARPGRQRLVIVENEVGEAGIDDGLLRQAGLEVRSLLAGCICCTLAAGLTETLSELHERCDPEYVIFEATGLAWPGRVTGTLKRYGAGIEWIRQVTVVDAGRWRRLRQVTPALVEHQVAGADLLLLNKCDLVGAAETDLVEADLRRLNPRAGLCRTVASSGLPDELWKRVLDDG